MDKSNFESYIVPDLLDKNLILVFVGTAPSRISAKKICYYGNKNNRFWSTLFEIKLVDKLIMPEKYQELLTYRIGLTDIIKRQAGNDNELKVSENDIKEFEAKIKNYKPKVIALTSKNAYKFYYGKNCDYGLQLEEMFGAKVFVLPSTSPLAFKFWDIKYWKELKKII